MLTKSIIRIGQSLINCSMPHQERIRLLTDVNSTSCKNYFQNVFLVELRDNEFKASTFQVGNFDEDNDFIVDSLKSPSFPFLFPNGGNPNLPQGIYPLPCYLMWDKHIKSMSNKQTFIKDFLQGRIGKTIGYSEMNESKTNLLCENISELVTEVFGSYIESEKQLGIFMIFDEQLPVYKRHSSRDADPLWIAESLYNSQHLYLDGKVVLDNIIKAKLAEAEALGCESNAVSTITNKREDKVVSAYNKAWLWLSPTWDMPKSIYWKDDEWTKGIKLDENSYAAFVYGAQFLKEIQVPVISSVVKEMFAPVTSVEAKKNIKESSYERIYGMPIVLPLLDESYKTNVKRLRRMLRNEEQLSASDLHLDVLAGLRKSIVPESSDEFRLSIIYFSGDLSRGNMHIRAVIEDIIPSIASKVQNILNDLNRSGLKKLQRAFDVKERSMKKVEHLPSLLANAYGPGYVWSSLKKVFNRKVLTDKRLVYATSIKLGALIKKQDYNQMKQELIFLYAFRYFLGSYQSKILGQKRGVRELEEWNDLSTAYHKGTINLQDLNNPEKLGFVTGLLLRQYSRSYYKKTNKDYIKHRVMKFGSKLTPDMIWKQGVLRCEELAQQWDMGLAKNFRACLPHLLLAFLDMQKVKLLEFQKDEFLTAFWAGYLTYDVSKPDKEEEVINYDDK